MNLLEQYIKEIHSEELANKLDWMTEDWVNVDVTTDCYGSLRRDSRMFPKTEWEVIKEKGYYMA